MRAPLWMAVAGRHRGLLRYRARDALRAGERRMGAAALVLVTV
ncbi:MAG: hypothetical protein OXT09_21615 [Myxococcales bacterium]|nr:hypothetical protein [Myxococcales bacterium]